MFDIIIIGGGHAGVEAACAAATFGLNVAIVTMPGIGLASAPCNPSVGGVGKGQVVRELDALGGVMGYLADEAGIQYRTLNESKGHAVQSTRVQIDKEQYSIAAEKLVASIPNINVIREKVTGVVKDSDTFVITTECSTWNSKKIIVTVGTFLNGKMHIGPEQFAGGRFGSMACNGMVDVFKDIKTAHARFKTGTPPRLDKNTIDYSKMEIQPSDYAVRNFHYKNVASARKLEQVNCYLTRTSADTIDIILANKERSPMYNGQIKGVGARYCPSIEDKANRYPEKHTHHVFIEPEGLNLDTVYPSGISSSLPRDVQEGMIKTLVGLENAIIVNYGYAVEYDVVDTTTLNITLEHKEIAGMYFAGQVNGTSGYEEAAGQGFIAGANAALSVLEQKPLTLSRHESYIGVMVEDLVSNLRDEPYRLFTARSENRLYLREDNTVIRMNKYRKSLGLKKEIDFYQNEYIIQFDLLMKILDELYLGPEDEFFGHFEYSLPRRMSFAELIKQSDINPIEVLAAYFKFAGLSVAPEITEAVAISKKYEGYIKRSSEQLQKMQRLDDKNVDWENLCQSDNISFECKQRIKRIKPTTFGQLKLIEGIRPATLAVVAGGAL